MTSSTRPEAGLQQEWGRAPSRGNGEPGALPARVWGVHGAENRAPRSALTFLLLTCPTRVLNGAALSRQCLLAALRQGGSPGPGSPPKFTPLRFYGQDSPGPPARGVTPAALQPRSRAGRVNLAFIGLGFVGRSAESPDLPLLIPAGTPPAPFQPCKWRGSEWSTPRLLVPSRGRVLGRVKALQQLLLVDFSHLVAWDLLHHDQLCGDGVRCHGVPATRRCRPSGLTRNLCFQPLLRPHKPCWTHRGCALRLCILPAASSPVGVGTPVLGRPWCSHPAHAPGHSGYHAPQQHPKTLLTPHRVQESLQQGGSAVNGDSSTLPIRCGGGKQHPGNKDAETVPVPGPVPAQSPPGGPALGRVGGRVPGCVTAHRALPAAGGRLSSACHPRALCGTQGEALLPSVPCVTSLGPCPVLAEALRRGAKSAEPSPAATSTPSTPSTPGQMDVSSSGWCRQARLGARAAK